MNEINIRTTGHAGRITLNRPKAMNAVTYDMCRAIETALDSWADDDKVELVIIDAVGDRAFSAGGDIAEMYRTASQGDFEYGRKFWADEYRMNAKIYNFPKPYIAFMQGFTMGGGVGVSCHGSHRIVGDTSRIAMPECGIGLIPDVGGSLLLAHAPCQLGEYLGTTGERMGPGDAIYAKFADYYIPEVDWPRLITELEKTGDHTLIDAAAQVPPHSEMHHLQTKIRQHFNGTGIGDIIRSLEGDPNDFTTQTLKSLRHHSPLSLACALEVIRRVKAFDTIEPALEMEYRFTYRSAEHGDFIEGIRAAIIDRDNAPTWRHHSIETLPASDVVAMLMPLGDTTLKL